MFGELSRLEFDFDWQLLAVLVQLASERKMLLEAAIPECLCSAWPACCTAEASLPGWYMEHQSWAQDVLRRVTRIATHI